MQSDNSIVIIGAGFAGMAAGIYAQMNGYSSEIYEMHDKPGGLCTSWKRKGYTIDGCIHWLVGSNPSSGIHALWEEVGIAAGREFVNPEEYMRFESVDGRSLVFYSDLNKMEKHLLEFSPQDAIPIKDFIAGIKMFLPMDYPSSKASNRKRMVQGLKLGWTFLTKGMKMKRWMNTTAKDFAERFHDPLLRKAVLEMWFPDFSIAFIFFMFAYMHNQNAGYPIGGSLPMSHAMEKRYLDLGGKIYYKERVEKILHKNGKANGLMLADGRQIHAERVISAADGHSTIFKMLDGKFGSKATHEPYDKWSVFDPLIYVGIGVNRTFPELPFSCSGLYFELREPLIIGDAERDSLWVNVFNQDPSMAPEGKTSLVVMLGSDYHWWKNLADQPQLYKEKKEEIALQVIEALSQRFSGIKDQVEMVDVATPLTFERYTGNWQGSFEGWLLTPENAFTAMRPMSQVIPGLQGFYMCGQWVEPGGGLPTSVMSARRLLKRICKEDRKKFQTLLT